MLAATSVHARPVEDKVSKAANIYVLGNLFNTAVSHERSKSQAASDRNESEWNNTEMLNAVKNQQFSAFRVQNKEKQKERSGDMLLYSGGDVANLALAFDGSESQAAENDQKSGYNNQNMGVGYGSSSEIDEDDLDDERK